MQILLQEWQVLLKVLWHLKNRQVPPSLHYKTANPEINIENSSFYVNTELKTWENDTHPLRAGVSSFWNRWNKCAHYIRRGTK